MDLDYINEVNSRRVTDNEAEIIFAARGSIISIKQNFYITIFKTSVLHLMLFHENFTP
jgi:hypothetical protein